MRKSIYIAAALATVALVGCQKELVPVGSEQGNAGLDQRPVLASSTLTIGDAATRATVKDADKDDISWVWEAGDRVGAMLVDQVKTEPIDGYVKNADPESVSWSYFDYVKGPKAYSVNGVSKNFLFTETYPTSSYGPTDKKHTSQEWYVRDQHTWTNYPYTLEGDAFTTPARLVEGHYVFYAPYNAKLATRGPLVVTLPKNQKVTKDEPTKAISDFFANEDGNPVVLGMSYLEAANTSHVEAQIGHIFAYPKITIKNNFNGYLFDGKKAKVASSKNDKSIVRYISTDEAAKYTMTIKQIQLYSNRKDAFAYQREVVVADDAQGATAGLYKAVTAKANEVGRWYEAKTDTKFQTASTSDVLSTTSYGEAEAYPKNKVPAFYGDMEAPSAMAALKQCVVVDFKDVELKNGEEFSFYAVVPAEDYTDGGLFARILVTIGEKDYYIVTNDIKNDVYDKTQSAVFEVTKELAESKFTDKDLEGFGFTSAVNSFPEGTGDYRFTDRNNKGSNTLVLVRGQRWPVAEVNEDKTTGVKDHRGNLMTINLVGGTNQAAFAADVKDETKDGGIVTNEDFIKYVNGVNQNAELTQVANEEDAEKSANSFYLNSENTIVLDNALIEALSRRQLNKTITFIDNLPIASDVVVKEATEKVDSKPTYDFIAGDYSFTVVYSGVDFNNDAEALTNGINVITAANVTLSVDDDVTGAVVFIKDGSSTVTVDEGEGISGIVVGTGNTLLVKTELDAWVLTPDQNSEAKVELQRGATMTNTLTNVKFVENSGKVAFAGKATTVNYTVGNLDIEAIPAATKINQLTIDPNQLGTVEISQENLSVLDALTNVTIQLSAKVGSLTSKADVDFTKANVKVAKVVAANSSTKWNTTSGETIWITYKKPASGSFFTNIENGTRVEFQEVK